MKNSYIFGIKPLCVILVLCLLMMSWTITLSADSKFDWSDWLTDETFELDDEKDYSQLITICEDERFCLKLNDANGSFCVYDKETDEYWYSNPQNWKDEETIGGSAKENINSQLVLNCYSEKQRQFVSVNTYTHSVKKGGYSYKKTENGFESTYKFEEYDLSVVLNIGLNNGVLIASVDTDKISDTNAFRIHDMSFLPYFAATDADDNGYMLIPDGSGAIIELNNGKTNLTPYEGEVYGESLSFSGSTASNDPSVMLPVFGLKRSDSGIVAIIEQGDSLASIHSQVSGQVNMFNTVYPEFVMRYYNYYDAGAYGATDFDVFEKGDFKCEKYTVSYHFLDEGNSDYANMAQLVQDNMNWSGGAKDYDCVIKVLAATRKIKSVLGVPVMCTETMTDIEALGSMLSELEEIGIGKTAVHYVGADRSELKYKVYDGITIDRKVGTLKELEALALKLLDSGNKIYLSYNPIVFKKGIFSSAKKISRDLLGQYIYVNLYTASGKLNDEIGSLVMLKPTDISKNTEKILKQVKGKSFGLSPTVIDSSVYTDFSWSGGEEQTKSLFADSIELMSSENGVLTSAATGYSLRLSEINTDIPRSSSKSDMFDLCVPFYEIVMSGKCGFAYSPINFNPDINTAFLKCIETGAIPQFGFYKNNKLNLRDSSDTDWYTGQFSEWLPELETYMQEYNAYSAKIDNRHIVSHIRLSQDVYKTGYENGCEVIVNYSDSEFDYNGTIVEGGTYMILDEVEQP